MAINLSLVTVTFWDDFFILERQLSSFDRYMSPGYTHTIILNDDPQHLPELEALVKKYTKFNYKTIHCNSISTAEQTEICGWTNQQLLKLLAHNVIDSKYYVTFDSKDYLTKPYDPLMELIPYDQPAYVRAAITGEGDFEAYYVNAYNMFGLDPDHYRPQTTDSRTPFVMETQLVKSLFDHLKDQGIRLKDLFDPAWLVTEFYLYTAWLAKNNKTVIWKDSLGVDWSYDGRRLGRAQN